MVDLHTLAGPAPGYVESPQVATIIRANHTGSLSTSGHSSAESRGNLESQNGRQAIDDAITRQAFASEGPNCGQGHHEKVGSSFYSGIGS